MFTVCPKCALTLVVTAQDLRVAQGYVRCGRCSNVFNAIVGLTDDRGALAGSQSTATTSIIRKAPSISDDELADDEPADPLSQTGETEAVYAEPDRDEVKFQEVFAEPPPASPPPSANGTPATEKRYSDTEGIETYPEHELEFNPALTDVTKVFVEAAPVAFKGDAVTGQFRKIVLKGDEGDVPTPSATAPMPPSPGTGKANGKASATPTSAPSPASARSPASTPSPASARSPASTPSPASVRSPASTPPPASATPRPAPSSATSRLPAAAALASTPPAKKPATPSRPSRDDEDQEIDVDLRAFAQRLDVTANRRAAGLQTAANDEPLGGSSDVEDARDVDADDDGSIGDIYAKAKPRPRPPASPPPSPPARGGTSRPGARTNISTAAISTAESDDDFETVGAADTLVPAQPRRGRFTAWIGGAALLSLALVAQAIHHNRHDLATNALLNRPLTRFYKAIGVTLVPNWDLTAYDVRQLGASTNEGSAGTLTVRASLKNTAPQPLPLPLLRITMQDRYGNRIATRDVTPTGYVPGTVPPDAQLGVGQRIDAEMTFKDPGQDAVGFEIDACLPSASGRILCANDVGTPSR